MATLKLTNTLSSCLSNPYLLHHAHNPVHWMPWGPQAHRLAKELHRPIFLSIGYTACHWCHVMAQESFESEEIAQMLNEYFVNIKVDKEERPDVDRFYMTYVQATTGSGGWPLTVFLTPDLQPFVGGSYFPPEEKWGQTGFKTLIHRVHKVWTEDSRTIEMKASNMFNMLKSSLLGQSAAQAETRPLQPGSLIDVSRRLLPLFSRRFRKEYGGFSDAPLFPRPSEMQCLLSLSSTGVLNKQEKGESVSMALHTLRKMAQGGIHDHIGGGFSRYSVDECWHVPHFEKMLYDNAQLLQTFVSAYRTSRNSYFANLGIEIFHYIKRDMTHSTGMFYSSQDADSRPTFDSTESKEGAYYVHSRQEIVDQLHGIGGDIFCFHFNIMEGGNCNLSARSDPHGEFRGLNVPIELGNDPIKQTAQHFKMSRKEIWDILQKGRRALLEYRQKTRPAPITDDKIITAWNAMMISACAQAHCVFALGGVGDVYERNGFLEAAVQAMESLETCSFVADDTTADKRLLRSIRFVEGKSIQGPKAFADDYAWMISAYLDLYEATANHSYIERARSLQRLMDDKFKTGGCYLSSDPKDDPSVLIQFPEMNDGAEPSPNSVAVANLYRLGNIVDVDEGKQYTEMAKAIWEWAQPTVNEVPSALPLLVANNIIFDLNADRLIKVVIIARQHDDTVQEFLRELWSRYLPSLSLVCITSKEAHDYFSRVNQTIKAMSYPQESEPAQVHLCSGFTCYPPITKPKDLSSMLDGLYQKGTHHDLNEQITSVHV